MNAVAHERLERDADFDLVHANLLLSFPELVSNLGGDPESLLRRVGIRHVAGERQASNLSYRSWVTLMEYAATELHCSDFGMRLARLQGSRMSGPVGAVMKHSRTFGEALEYVANHSHAHSLAAAIRVERRNNQLPFVSHEFLLDRLPNRRQAVEQVLLLGHLHALAITGGQAHARAVHFRHQPLSSRSAYRAYFGVPVRFDEKEDGLVFSEQDLRTPIVERNEHLYASATSFIDTRFGCVTPPVHAQVRAVIVRLIDTEDCSNERVSEVLDIHPRTLHRRLKAEGKSFEGIKDEVRRDQALRYLQETDHPLSVIAERLGYAEQSVLTRSCIRWFAQSPSRLRSRSMH